MGQLKVRDIMTTQVVTLKPENTVREAIKKLAVENLTGAPVVDKNNCMIGIISQNDILRLILKFAKGIDAAGGDGSALLNYYLDEEIDEPMIKEAVETISSMKIENIMTRTVLSTSPDDLVIALIKSMDKMAVNRVPVLDKGILLGIVTRGDIVFSIYKKKRI